MAIHKERTMLYVLIFATVINIVLNLILIPEFSATGSAIAAVLTHSFIFFCYANIARRAENTFSVEKELVLISLGSILLGGVTYYFNHLNLILLIAFYSVAYLCLTLSLLKEERQLIVEMITSKNKDREGKGI